MPNQDNTSLLVDNLDQTIPEKEFLPGNDIAKCILKVKGDKIIDVQETQVNIFDCDIKKVIGKSVYKIFPEYQPDGNLSTDVFRQIIEGLQLGHPISASLQIMTTTSQLFYADVSIFTFEKDKYYITLSPRKFEIPTVRQTLADHEVLNLQNLVTEGALMFKCYDPDGSVYYLNSAYLEFTATSFRHQLKDGWIKSISIFLSAIPEKPTICFASSRMRDKSTIFR